MGKPLQKRVLEYSVLSKEVTSRTFRLSLWGIFPITKALPSTRCCDWYWCNIHNKFFITFLLFILTFLYFHLHTLNNSVVPLYCPKHHNVALASEHNRIQVYDRFLSNPFEEFSGFFELQFNTIEREPGLTSVFLCDWCDGDEIWDQTNYENTNIVIRSYLQCMSFVGEIFSSTLFSIWKRTHQYFFSWFEENSSLILCAESLWLKKVKNRVNERRGRRTKDGLRRWTNLPICGLLVLLIYAETLGGVAEAQQILHEYSSKEPSLLIADPLLIGNSIRR